MRLDHIYRDILNSVYGTKFTGNNYNAWVAGDSPRFWGFLTGILDLIQFNAATIQNEGESHH